MAQALKDSIKFATKDTATAKKNLASSQEKKSAADGDLKVTSKDLSEDITALADLHRDCMAKAEDFESATKTRGEELAALAKAKEIIIEATGGAASFLQTIRTKLTSAKDLSSFEAVRLVRDLARKHKSPALAQLASRMASVRSGDVFGKIRGLINDMIDKLQAEAEGEATEKAWCDKELSESNAKKGEQETSINKLSTKIDQATARSAKLKEEASALQEQLSELGGSQAEMDKIRSEEKGTFTANEAETSKGLDGIKLALKVLRDYYAKADSSSEGAAGGIVSLLEVCESDFSKSLAEMRATEESSAAEFDKQSKENDIMKTTKEQDVKYKTKDSTSLAKSAAEMTSDRSGVQTEMDAVLEYLKQLEKKCVVKAESYADKTAAREAEIVGLKEALDILEGQAVLMQTQRSLRGVQAHRV